MSISIQYGDVPVGAREAFHEKTNYAEFQETLSQLTETAAFPNYSNPLEEYQMLLNGESMLVPDTIKPEVDKLGLWSTQISGVRGLFSTPVELILEADDKFSTQTIALTFDKHNDIYATELEMVWYRDGEELDRETFYPDSAFYYCDNSRGVVAAFNKVVITFKKMNMQGVRLRLTQIDFGFGLEFTGGQLKSAKVVQEIDPISVGISINTFDFGLHYEGSRPLYFQQRQPLTVNFNGDRLATHFVKSARRKSKTQWDVKTEDYIGSMDSIEFRGGLYEDVPVYSEREGAKGLINELFDTAQIPFEFDDALKDKEVSGYIPYTTCREALVLIAFAIGAVVDTSNSDKVRIYSLPTGNKEIQKNRLLQGQSFNNKTVVTKIEVAEHAYVQSEDAKVVYDATKSGAGENILVRFSEPLHDLNPLAGENGFGVVEYGDNYAIINADANTKITGSKYNHTIVVHSKKNPAALENDVENEVSISDATLVSSSNVDEVLERCSEYYFNHLSAQMRIAEVSADDKASVGAQIIFDTEYLGRMTGRITKQTFSLSGGVIFKDSTVEMVEEATV